MLDASAIKEIKNLSQSTLVELDDLHFIQTTNGVTPVNFPREETVEVFSLTQIVSFLKVFPLGEDQRLLVNIIDHKNVEVIRDSKSKDLKNICVVKSSFEDVFQEFESNNKFNQEDFIIRLQSRFVQDENCMSLIKLVSGVSHGKTSESVDNGYAQVATVKSGVHLVTEVDIKPIWDLRPFKSFPEIEPVVIPFILRLHQRGEEMPQFAMYEADGCRWKIETTKRVKEYLEKELSTFKGISVL